MHFSDRHRWVCFALVVVFLGLVGVGFFSKRGYRDWRAIGRKNDELRGRIADLERQKTDLERRNHLMMNSTEHQDRVVRRVLGYVRPDELVVEFD